MAFGVATNNRFNLFVDEDEEPDDLLTKQQRQVADERQRKDSERRSAAKLKTGGEHAPGTGQTPLTTVKPSSNNAAAVTVAPSSGNGICTTWCNKYSVTHWLYAGQSCTICQFWLFAGQCKTIVNRRKLLYIFGSEVSICVGDEFDNNNNNNNKLI